MTQKYSPMLRITKHDGVVWYGDDDRMAVCSDKNMDEFLLTDTLRNARVVRVIGHPQNCDFIEKLFHAHLIAGLPKPVSIQVGSPAMAGDDSPVLTLAEMWRASVDRSAINGYWATLNDKDYATFLLMSVLHSEGGINDKALHTAQHHPAWPAVSFVWRYDPIAAIKLLVDIGDPRWYTHPTRPGRLSRLYSHLGLNPTNIRMMYREHQDIGPHFLKAKNLVDVWRSKTSADNDCQNPKAFLHRIERKHEYMDHGVMVASKRLIRFVREVWMAARTEDPEAGFSPEKFFRRSEEVIAFKRHKRSGPTEFIDTAVGD